MNPYAPPEATVKDLPAKAGSAFKAVALGLGADIGGTFLAGIALALIYGVVLGASGASTEEIMASTKAIGTDSWLFYAGVLVGLAFSVLGGYVCARIARRDEMKLGAILAGLSALIGVLFSGEAYQLGTLASLTLAGIGAVMIGARLGYAKNRSNK
jgi:uncharacterized membrane protein